MTTVVLWFGIGALLLAAILYLVLLPHVEGPNPNAQRADTKFWLVECPNCHEWKLRSPVSSSAGEEGDQVAYSNWYLCHACNHRWREDYGG